MGEANKNERANAPKEVKHLFKEFGFTTGMLKGVLGRNIYHPMTKNIHAQVFVSKALKS